MADVPRLLVLFSHPFVDGKGLPLQLLDSEAEREALLRVFADHQIPVHVCFDIATAENLCRHLAEGCDWLHYSGHGAPDCLAFEDGSGGTHELRPEEFAELVTTANVKLPDLAFVSACHSEPTGLALSRAGVRHVVAVQTEDAVRDRAATTFAREFYRQAALGRCVRDCFQAGVAAVKSDPELRSQAAPEARKFLLLPQDHEHNEQACTCRETGPPVDETPSGTPASPPLAARREDFTGRAIELHNATQLVLSGRLVTLRGAPGIGKTQVAVEVARWCAERRRFRDGIHFIELRKAESAGLIRTGISAAIGIEPEDDAQLAAALGDSDRLLVLDNLEDPLLDDGPGTRALLSAILRGSRNTRLLITSRHPVGGGLPAPERVVPILPLPTSDALLLFCRNTAEPTDVNALWANDDFRHIMEHLGNHPLSISIVASHHPEMTLAEIRTALEENPEVVLEAADRSPDEQDALSSLAVSISISYRRLQARTPLAAKLFVLLSLVPGGADEPALEAITDFDWRPAVHALHRHSLVERDPLGRYFLLPPVSRFARKYLNDEDFERCRPRLIRHFADRATTIYRALGGEHSMAARMLLALDEATMRACLDLRFVPPQSRQEPSVNVQLAIHLVACLGFVHRIGEALTITLRTLMQARSEHDRLGEATTLLLLGDLRLRTGDLAGAQAAYDEALPLYREIQERLGEANTLKALGDLRRRTDDLAGAQAAYDEALPLYREIEARLGEANTLKALGDLRLRTGDLAGAQAAYDEALPLYREIQERLGEANTLKALGDLRLRTGDLAGAQAAYDEALPLYREIQERLGEANTLDSLGKLALAQGNPNQAVTSFDAALEIYRSMRDRWNIADTLLNKAPVTALLGDRDRALQDIAEAASLAGEIRDDALLRKASKVRQLVDSM